MTINLTEETAHRPDETLLRVDGTVDLSTAGALTQRLQGLAQTPGRTVLVDLAGVGFMDSTGLSALVGAQLTAGQRGSTMILAHPTDNVRSLLHLTGLDQVLQIQEAPGPRATGAMSHR